MKIEITSRKLALIVFLLLSTIKNYGQYEVFLETETMASLKKRMLYVALGDKDAEASKPYIDMIKKTWSLSNVEFISHDDILKHKSEQALFLTVENNIVNYNDKHVGDPLWDTRVEHDYSYLFLTLWYSNNSPDKIQGNKSDRQTIMQFSLFADFPTEQSPALALKSDYALGGHIRNWSVGILKNYLQTAINELNGLESKLVKNVNLTEIKNLQTQPLYVPDYVLIRFDKWNGNEEKRADENDLMGGYKFPYKIVSTEELNAKILDEQNPVYYLVYVKNSATKGVSVINSKDGSTIYFDIDWGSYNIKSGDLKAISNKVK